MRMSMAVKIVPLGDRRVTGSKPASRQRRRTSLSRRAASRPATRSRSSRPTTRTAAGLPGTCTTTIRLRSPRHRPHLRRSLGARACSSRSAPQRSRSSSSAWCSRHGRRTTHRCGHAAAGRGGAPVRRLQLRDPRASALARRPLLASSSVDRRRSPGTRGAGGHSGAGREPGTVASCSVVADARL